MSADGVKTILIVDDEPDIATVVSASLEDEGYRVLAAANGVEGLRCLAHSSPDLLICDLMMPYMDGATMCEQMRMDPKCQDVRIVITTVMDEATIASRFTDYDGYLRKPFRLAALLELVDTLVARQ